MTRIVVVLVLLVMTAAFGHSVTKVAKQSIEQHTRKVADY